MHFEDVRVSLDVLRVGVRSLQWTPFQLSPRCCSNSADFVTLLDFVRGTVLSHCRSPVPLLLDVNLYYRHLKMWYSKGYGQWRYQ